MQRMLLQNVALAAAVLVALNAREREREREREVVSYTNESSYYGVWHKLKFETVLACCFFFNENHGRWGPTANPDRGGICTRRGHHFETGKAWCSEYRLLRKVQAGFIWVQNAFFFACLSQFKKKQKKIWNLKFNLLNASLLILKGSCLDECAIMHQNPPLGVYKHTLTP